MRILVAAALVGLALAPLMAQAAPGSTRAYAGPVFLESGCTVGAPAASVETPAHNVACWRVPAGVRTAYVHVTDETGRLVGATVWWRVGLEQVGHARLCGSALLEVPAGATLFSVELSPLDRGADPPTVGCGVPPVAGRVSAQFH